MLLRSVANRATLTAAAASGRRFFYSNRNRFCTVRLFSSLSSSFSSQAAAAASTSSPLDQMDEKTRSLAQVLTSPGQEIWKHRIALAKAITLVENRTAANQKQAGLLLTYLLQSSHQQQPQQYLDGGGHDGNFRLGIAGPPGAGKSTFIEALGTFVLDKLPYEQQQQQNDKNNKSSSSSSSSLLWRPSKLAVICIDPSSVRTGGSILGDKTRMTELSRHPRAFVRPSSASGALGGLAAYTDDAVTVSQAAGYDWVTIETVGLGQSETEVAQSVDMLLLIVPPGGGDDLQGSKKGILEVADMLLVNKADGTLLPAAKATAADYKGAMQFLWRGYSSCENLPGWEHPPVMLASAYTGDGLLDVWTKISDFRKQMMESGLLQKRRQAQKHYWMWKNLQNLVRRELEEDQVLERAATELRHQLDDGYLTPRVAAAELLSHLRHSRPT